MVWQIEGLTIDDRVRWTGHCRAIATKLRQGPIHLSDIDHISMKPGNRISDLRKNGWEIRCDRYPRPATYVLVKEGTWPILDEDT